MSTGKEPRAPALTGADIVIKCLEAEGVEYVFGYPGGAVLYIYDALFKQDKIKHVLVRHEQGATHAADGYSRASKKVGVALVTSGPGLTNAVTGIATAYLVANDILVDAMMRTAVIVVVCVLGMGVECFLGSRRVGNCGGPSARHICPDAR